MGSKSETGHAKNVANLEQMLAYCVGYGTIYQPNKILIQITTMQQLLLDARNSLREVTEHLTAYNIAKNAAKDAFENLPVLTSQIINSLAATDVSDKTLEDARSIARKIKGIRAKKKEIGGAAKESATVPDAPDDTEEEIASEPDTESTNDAANGNGKTTKSHSSAQTSRDQQVEHFGRLLSLLKSEPAYQPNEIELQVTTLEQYLETMHTSNSELKKRYAELSNARIRRDELIYGAKTGICDVAADVKLYVKSVFKPSSPQFKQLSRLRFVRRR